MSDVPAAKVNEWAHDLRNHVHVLRVAFSGRKAATADKPEVEKLLTVAEKQFESIRQVIAKMATESGTDPDATDPAL
jgi:hypothetical protein